MRCLQVETSLQKWKVVSNQSLLLAKCSRKSNVNLYYSAKPWERPPAGPVYLVSSPLLLEKVFVESDFSVQRKRGGDKSNGRFLAQVKSTALSARLSLSADQTQPLKVVSVNVSVVSKLRIP